jgi:hypothetical protein
VPGGDEPAGGAAVRRAVADIARPALDVAFRPPGVHDVERHGEPVAQRRAVGRVVRGVGPEPVVDVQRAHVGREPHREVEQADRVAAAGEQDEHRLGEQATGAHPRLDRRRAGHGSAGRAR